MLLSGLLYKEWIKLKWPFVGSLFVALFSTAYVFLTLKHDLKFSTPAQHWNMILFFQFKYYKYLNFIPLVISFGMAIAQFYPEILNKRMKLSFHLPYNENKVLLYMVAIGFSAVFVVSLFQMSLFVGLSSIYFPREIVFHASISVATWLLASWFVYFWTSMVVIEPSWTRRISSISIGLICLFLFMESGGMGVHLPAFFYYLIIIILSFLTILYSGWRFRKGIA